MVTKFCRIHHLPWFADSLALVGMQNWYYERGGEQLGPIAEEQLVEMVDQGTLSRDCLVWTSGMKTWQPAEELEALGGQFRSETSAVENAAPAEVSRFAMAPEHVEPVSVNPYAAPLTEVSDATSAPEILADVIVAGRWLRLGAAFIDYILLGVGVAFVSKVLGSSWVPHYSYGVSSLVLPIVVYAAMNGVFLYRDGQTLGKKLFGIQIVNYYTGAVPGLGRSFGIRYVIPQVLGGMCCCLFNLIDVLMIFGEEKRCLHDFMAGTRVIIKDRSTQQLL